jgi:hypothetical protein
LWFDCCGSLALLIWIVQRFVTSQILHSYMTPSSLRAAVLALTCFCAIGTAHANIITVANWDFESPDVPGSFQYNPTSAGWTFNNLSGVAANGSGFLVENAPDGQAGFVQNSAAQTSSLTQTLSGFLSGNFYTVRFIAQGRQGGAYGTNPLEVQLGGQTLTFTYNNTQLVDPIAGTTFYTYSSVPITGLNGSALLSFTGTANPVGGDTTTFIDNVQVYSPGDSVPGPFGPVAPGTPVP